MRHCLVLCVLLGVLLFMLPGCGSREPGTHQEELPKPRIPQMPKKK
jgi:hypothetical protein